MKYEKGDLVFLSSDSDMHAGELVFILDYHPETDSYDFVIPEVRGSVPSKYIDRIAASGLSISHRRNNAS